MSIRPTSEHPGAMRNRRGPAARVAGTIGVPALAVLCGGLLTQPAEAAPKLCGDRDQILKRLEQAHEETPQAIGLSGDGGVVEVLVSPDGGWTMLVTFPQRPTCVSGGRPRLRDAAARMRAGLSLRRAGPLSALAAGPVAISAVHEDKPPREIDRALGHRPHLRASATASP